MKITTRRGDIMCDIVFVICQHGIICELRHCPIFHCRGQVKEVQAKREQRFFENRHRGAKAKEKASIKAEIKDNIELLAPAAADREKALLAVSDKAKQVSCNRPEAAAD